jgi:hypothetical protein
MTPCNCNALSIPHHHNEAGIIPLASVMANPNQDARARAQNDYDGRLYHDDMVDPATGTRQFSDGRNSSVVDPATRRFSNR